MTSPKILASGRFAPDDLVVSVSESNRKINSAFEGQIDDLWKIKSEKAREQGIVCYNGITYRLNSVTQEDGKLLIDFGIIEYKTRQCLPEIPGYFDLSEEYYRKGCHTLATVKTVDEKYIMVELSGKSMNKNSIDFLGGIMDIELPIKTGEDVFNSLYKELEEEGMIKKEDVREIFLKMIYMNVNTNIGFYFEIILNIPSDELLERFEKASRDEDIKSLKVFSKTEYLDTLQHHNVNKQLISAVVEM